MRVSPDSVYVSWLPASAPIERFTGGFVKLARRVVFVAWAFRGRAATLGCSEPLRFLKMDKPGPDYLGQFGKIC